ncbi:hypothetical protein [Sulfuriferula sp.]|uniref:hypothetical protein n=1 Tax=Sulfuriferula sp. TaxID=2025307 RepID=UPI0027320B8B|nr:hypothetical protein [Sulfuriferula sp.]MDP2027638.1 hypothetical protein [Sulfuriferula sp.]
MKDFIGFLVEQSRLDKIAVNPALDDALTHLDHTLAGLSESVQVEYKGPFVGVETLKAHQLMVLRHEWKIHQPSWSMKVCVAAPEANCRAEWPVQGVSRLRKVMVVKALPEFFAGFSAAVQAAGKADSPAGVRIIELVQRFNQS